MIYLDSSVALAQLLTEDRCPPGSLWDEPLISSRLLEYEIWNRIHARKLSKSHAEPARLLLGRVSMLELARPVLERALERFPSPVRTLDAIHLASIHFLREQGVEARLATYDARLLDVARKLRFPVADV